MRRRPELWPHQLIEELQGRIAIQRGQLDSSHRQTRRRLLPARLHHQQRRLQARKSLQQLPQAGVGNPHVDEQGRPVRRRMGYRAQDVRPRLDRSHCSPQCGRQACSRLILGSSGGRPGRQVTAQTGGERVVGRGETQGGDDRLVHSLLAGQQFLQGKQAALLRDTGILTLAQVEKLLGELAPGGAGAGDSAQPQDPHVLELLLELPQQARLSHRGAPVEPHLPLAARRHRLAEVAAQLRKLTLAAHDAQVAVGVTVVLVKRRNQPVGGTHVRKAGETHRRAGLVDEHVPGRLIGIWPHPHLTGYGGRLQARGQVHRRAHHGVVTRAGAAHRTGDDGTRVYAGAPLQRVAFGSAYRLDGTQCRVSGQYRPLRVVRVGAGCAEEGDEAVPLEGIHVTVEVLDDAGDDGQDLVGQVAQLFRDETEGEGGERGQVDEQHGHPPPFPGAPLLQALATHAAEACPCRVLRVTGLTDQLASSCLTNLQAQRGTRIHERASTTLIDLYPKLQGIGRKQRTTAQVAYHLPLRNPIPHLYFRRPQVRVDRGERIAVRDRQQVAVVGTHEGDAAHHAVLYGEDRAVVVLGP